MPVRFVRGGVYTDHFEARSWSLGDTVHGQQAPRTAECVRLGRVEALQGNPSSSRTVIVADEAMLRH